MCFLKKEDKFFLIENLPNIKNQTFMGDIYM